MISVVSQQNAILMHSFRYVKEKHQNCNYIIKKHCTLCSFLFKTDLKPVIKFLKHLIQKQKCAGNKINPILMCVHVGVTIIMQLQNIYVINNKNGNSIAH